MSMNSIFTSRLSGSIRTATLLLILLLLFRLLLLLLLVLVLLLVVLLLLFLLLLTSYIIDCICRFSDTKSIYFSMVLILTPNKNTLYINEINTCKFILVAVIFHNK